MLPSAPRRSPPTFSQHRFGRHPEPTPGHPLQNHPLLTLRHSSLSHGHQPSLGHLYQHPPRSLVTPAFPDCCHLRFHFETPSLATPTGSLVLHFPSPQRLDYCPSHAEGWPLSLLRHWCGFHRTFPDLWHPFNSLPALWHPSRSPPSRHPLPSPSLLLVPLTLPSPAPPQPPPRSSPFP